MDGRVGGRVGGQALTLSIINSSGRCSDAKAAGRKTCPVPRRRVRRSMAARTVLVTSVKYAASRTDDVAATRRIF